MQAEIIKLAPDNDLIKVFDSGLTIRGRKIFIESTGSSKEDRYNIVAMEKTFKALSNPYYSR